MSSALHTVMTKRKISYKEYNVFKNVKAMLTRHHSSTIGFIFNSLNVNSEMCCRIFLIESKLRKLLTVLPAV